MKKTSFLTIMIAFIAMSAFAQAPATPNTSATPQARPKPPSTEEMAKMQTERLNKQVNLTPEQYKKVMDVNKDFMTQMEANRPTPGQKPSQEQMEKMKKVRTDKDDKINAILTADQRAKMEAERKEHMGNRPAPGSTTPAGK